MMSKADPPKAAAGKARALAAAGSARGPETASLTEPTLAPGARLQDQLAAAALLVAARAVQRAQALRAPPPPRQPPRPAPGRHARLQLRARRVARACALDIQTLENHVILQQKNKNSSTRRRTGSGMGGQDPTKPSRHPARSSCWPCKLAERCCNACGATTGQRLHTQQINASCGCTHSPARSRPGLPGRARACVGIGVGAARPRGRLPEAIVALRLGLAQQPRRGQACLAAAAAHAALRGRSHAFHSGHAPPCAPPARSRPMATAATMPLSTLSEPLKASHERRVASL